MNKFRISNLLKYPALILCLFCFFSAASYCVDSATGRKIPRSIVIASEDIKNFGGWPLERRWYSVLIKKIQESGAKRVFIDIAFPSADILHPESDELLYHQLGEWPGVYLLMANEPGKASLILGDKEFDPHRTFLPLSEGLTLNSGYLQFQKGSGSLIDFFLPAGFDYDAILIDIPDEDISPDYNLSRFLTEEVNLTGEDVIVYLNYPGVSSYILTSRSIPSTSSSLQIWVIRQVISGNYEVQYPPWKFILFGGLAWIPLILNYVLIRQRKILFISSPLIWIILTVIFILYKIHLDVWWFLVLLPAALIAVNMLLIKLRDKFAGRNSQTVIKITEEINEKNTEQLRELRYKLDYYEKLSTQIPLSAPVNDYEALGIYCHNSSPLLDILRKAEQVARDDIPVIIYGESGTGKEKLAQFIHSNSPKKDRPFVAVNCGGLNENLIESELFGYEKGAFTGAYQSKQGRFEIANGGTLFLDEVSETSLPFQVKLLRVLQEGVFERVGGTKQIKVSVRVIAATHQDLGKLIQGGSFREDLYYRLNGYEFFIPALRNRQVDIEHLFRHFLFETDPKIKYSDPLIEWLREQAWPGNVRQLKSSTRRAVINAQVHNRSFLIPKDFDLATAKRDSVDESEKLSEKILQRFRDHEFHYRSISAVAADLMLHRTTVTEYLRGWVVRFLNTGNLDLEYVISSMKSTAPIADESQYRSRIYEYIDYIRTRIIEGIEKGLTDSEIQAKIFKNLPGVFREDLIQLVQKIRKSRAV